MFFFIALKYFAYSSSDFRHTPSIAFAKLLLFT